MEPTEQLTCEHCGNRFPRPHPIGRKPTFCPDHNTPRKRASSPAPRQEVEIPLEARLRLRAEVRKVRTLVDSVQPNVEPMRLAAEAMRSQLSWLDRDSFGGLAALNGLGGLMAEWNMTSLAQFEPIGAMFAREIGASMAAVKLSVPEWPPPGMVTALSMVGEQAKLLSDSIGTSFVDAQLSLASTFTAVSSNLDFDIASKLAGLDTERLFALIGDENEPDESVVDEVADELDTDRSRIVAAQAVLRAVVGLFFDNLSDPDGLARDSAKVFDDQLNALKDAHGDNPYLWLIGQVFTVVTAYQLVAAMANKRTNHDEESDD